LIRASGDRPPTRRIAGRPIAFRFDDGRSSGGHASLAFTWEHRPELGSTEILLPRTIFPPDSTIEVSDPGLTCRRDEGRQVVEILGGRGMMMCVRIKTP
jgi:hypothetical protein